jgi:hypothetical protein
MLNLKQPQRKDRKIDFDTWCSVINLLRKLSNIKFDPKIFNVRDENTGLYVTANSSTFTSEAFSGIGYAPNGDKTEDLNTNKEFPWVKFDISTNTFTEEIGPAPRPWGANEYWYLKKNTYGDIVVTR